jgi:aminopeptidase N
MKRAYLSLLCVLCLLPLLRAQSLHQCKGFGAAAVQGKATVASPLEDLYDISHIRFQLHMSDTSAYIAGSVTTTARAVAAISQYAFELDTALTIDSVTINGIRTPVSSAGIVHTATLPSPADSGTTFAAQVYYHGHPWKEWEVWQPGLHCDSDVHITFTISEPYYALRWWPCKQSVTDKADSVDMYVTVPQGVRVGSNGLLTDTLPQPGGRVQHHWQTRYPMAFYLISLAISRYYEYSYYMHFNGSTDSMPVVNYIPNKEADINRIQPFLDSTALLINDMSDSWGRYPFWQEKYGHCFTTSGINMEHQTMTTTRFSNLSVVVHELAHQWFGNLVTCASWRDIWLNEGFATYAQYLAYNRYSGTASGRQYMASLHADVMKEPGGSVYVDDTTSSDRIFNGRLSYSKAAAVIHMLRYSMGDVAFDTLLHRWLRRYAWGNANTTQLQLLAEEVAGKRYYTFFRQWIYGTGYPVAELAWNQVDGQVFFRLRQKGTGNIAVYDMPVEVTLKTTTGDTTLILHTDHPEQYYTYSGIAPVSDVVVNPNLWLLLQCTTQHTPSLDLRDGVVHLHPNPAATSVWVSYAATTAPLLSLLDVAGRTVLQQWLPAGPATQEVSVAHLPPGTYLYRVTANGVNIGRGTFVRQ